MSQTNNGNQGYVESKYADTVKKIEDQYNLFKLDKVTVDDSISSYINMDENALYKQTPEELAIAEIKLQSFSFAIQKHHNRANAVKNWAQKCLTKIVASCYKEYDKFTKYDVVEKSVISTNTYAQKLDEIISEQEQIIEQFNYMSQTIYHLAETFGKLARIRSSGKNIQ